MPAPKGNKFALGNSGKPARYDSVKELSDQVNKYFDYCIKNKEKITITGLALFLGFESRQSFYDYEKKKEFTYVLKRAKLAVENYYETRGQIIDIFALKNMGWQDKTEHDITSGGEKINITFSKKE